MPQLIRQDDTILRLIKDVNDIQQALRRVVANLPLYDISNENTPAQITADQNDYVPGNFDVLRLSTDAPRTITGFRGGVKGRFLTLFNIGSFEITISHLSGLSLLGNRVKSPTSTNIVINAGGQLVLYYDITNNQWISSYATNSDRISVELQLSGAISIPDSSYVQITWGSIVKDTGGFFNVGSPDIVTIPESGWYDVYVTAVFDSSTVGYRETILLTSPAHVVLLDTRLPVNAPSTTVSISRIFYLNKGDTVFLRVWQNSGGPLNINFAGDAGSRTTLVVSKL